MNKNCILPLFCIYSVTWLHAANEVNTSESIDVDDIGDEDIDDDVFEDNDDQNIDDPYEKINRKIFEFNESLDGALNRLSNPGSKPGVIRKGLSNFAQNFFEIPRFINFTLQGNGKNAGRTVCRYIINTCIGFFGLIDVAGALGLKKQRTVFNDILKKWGVPPGDFIVLPFLGPTSMRGAVSQMVHIPLDCTALLPIKNLKHSVKGSVYCLAWVFDALNTRSAYGDFLKNITAMSKDRYKTVRNLIMATEQ